MRVESINQRQKNPFAAAFARESHQLRVLTHELAEDLAAFNCLSRELTRLGVPILERNFTERSMKLSAKEAGQIFYSGPMKTDDWSFQRSAGGCRVQVRFRGICLRWYEPLTNRPINEVLR